MGAAARRVVTGLQHGDIWLAELDKLRPVLERFCATLAYTFGC